MRLLSLLLCLLATTASAVPRLAWVAVGDSYTYGYGQVATPYPAALTTTLGVPVVNLGMGGETAASINTRLTSHVRRPSPTHSRPFYYKGVILEECINDLIASTAGATCWAATEAAADDVLADGFLLVLITAPPCGNYATWNPTKETERDAYNTSLRAYVAAHPGQAFLVDLDTVISDDTNTIKASMDYGDGLHVNQTGMTAIANAIADVI